MYVIYLAEGGGKRDEMKPIERDEQCFGTFSSEYLTKVESSRSRIPCKRCS